MNHFAEALVRSQRPQEALDLVKESTPGTRIRLGFDHPEAIRALETEASALRSLGRIEDAVESYAEILALQKIRFGPQHEDTRRTGEILEACRRELAP